MCPYTFSFLSVNTFVSSFIFAYYMFVSLFKCLCVRVRFHNMYLYNPIIYSFTYLLILVTPERIPQTLQVLKSVSWSVHRGQKALGPHFLCKS